MEKENSNISAREAWEMRQALARQQVAPPDVEEQWEAFEARHAVHEEQAEEPASHRARVASMVRWIVGVAAVAVVAVGLWQWSATRQTAPSADEDSRFVFQATENEQDVTLTADNGKPQAIDADSPVLAEATKGKELKLVTPRGQDYHLTLPDGTEVWLNGESELRFPSRFGKGNREVSLRGEAYFAVAKDAAHPFIVHTEQLTARVLGTSFNIRAYARGNTCLTLVEGSVAVSLPTGNTSGKSIVLKPGQQCAIVNAQCQVTDVDTYPITQWKEGFFYFDNATMLEIMQELARWYNVNVAFDNPATTRVRLHFVAERSGSLAEAIRQLNALGEAKVELSDNIITIR